MALAAVFAFGFMVGRLTEPVSTMPAGVPISAWLGLAALVGAVLAPFAKAARVKRHAPSPLRDASVDEVISLDTALELFPGEEAASEAPEREQTVRSSPARVIKIAS